MTLSREEKLKILSELPPDLQEIIFSDNTVIIVDKICKKYNLSEEKSDILVSLISDVLFGNISIEKLSIILKEKIEIDEQTIVNISSDLTTELFSKIKTSLQKIRPSEQTMLSPSNTIIPTSAPTPAPIPITPVAPLPQPVAPIAKPQIPDTRPQSPSDSFGGRAKYQIPPSDRYREPLVVSRVEPTNGMPARQRPEPQALAGGPEIVDLRKTPPPPIPGLVSPAPIPPSLVKPITPLTFTKPVEKPIETPKPAPIFQPQIPKAETPLIEAEPHKKEEVKITETLTPHEERPQFIIRPPGLAPTDLPHDVLDLRQDKGEF